MLTPVRASATCHAFLPYGWNQEVLSLPRSETFCVYVDTQEIHYSTDEFGGRVLGKLGPRAVVFGESQALAMDSNLISPIFFQDGFDSVVLYATPNSGPLEILARVRSRRYNSADDYYFVFNFGFDLFRLAGWNPRQHVSSQLADVEKLLSYPRLLGIWSLLRGATGEAVGLSGDNSREMLERVRKRPSIYRDALSLYANRFLPNILDTVEPIQSRKTLLIYPPYWDPDYADRDVRALRDHLAIQLTHLKGVQILWVKVRSTDHASVLTGDRRHFKSESLQRSHQN